MGLFAFELNGDVDVTNAPSMMKKSRERKRERERVFIPNFTRVSKKYSGRRHLSQKMNEMWDVTIESHWKRDDHNSTEKPKQQKNVKHKSSFSILQDPLVARGSASADRNCIGARSQSLHSSLDAHIPFGRRLRYLHVEPGRQSGTPGTPRLAADGN